MRSPERHQSATSNRRTFLSGAIALAGAGTIGVLAADPAAAQIDCGDTITVYRLDTDWGYPRGPHGKTHLESNASKQAAAHRWALTAEDAENMNLHLCSYAPAIPVVVDREAFMAIWNHNGAGAYVWNNPWNGAGVEIFDTRCLAHIDDGDLLWAKAMAPCGDEAGDSWTSTTAAPTGNPLTGTTTTGAEPTAPSSTSTNSTTPAPTAATTTPTGTATGTESSTASSGSIGEAPENLAFTGRSTRMAGIVGAALVGTGWMATRMARDRRRAVEALHLHHIGEPLS